MVLKVKAAEKKLGKHLAERKIIANFAALKHDLSFMNGRDESLKGLKRRMPAEWEHQSMVQLTWPHKDTDWAPMLPEITAVYAEMAREISKRENLLIVAPADVQLPSPATLHAPNTTIHTSHFTSNDTWARDHGFITVAETSNEGNEETVLLDFCFNGWGEKFEAEMDNRINRHLYEQGLVKGRYEDHLDFVLEGGSIESDGKGTIFTTSCSTISLGKT